MDRAKLEAMLFAGTDNVMLRYALASLLLKEGELHEAITHLEKALEQDSSHSASWKMLGKALTASGQTSMVHPARRVYLAAAACCIDARRP